MCGQRYTPGHFDVLNVFGCPAMQAPFMSSLGDDTCCGRLVPGFGRVKRVCLKCVILLLTAVAGAVSVCVLLPLALLWVLVVTPVYALWALTCRVPCLRLHQRWRERLHPEVRRMRQMRLQAPDGGGGAGGQEQRAPVAPRSPRAALEPGGAGGGDASGAAGAAVAPAASVSIAAGGEDSGGTALPVLVAGEVAAVDAPPTRSSAAAAAPAVVVVGESDDVATNFTDTRISVASV